MENVGKILIFIYAMFLLILAMEENNLRNKIKSIEEQSVEINKRIVELQEKINELEKQSEEVHEYILNRIGG